MKYKFCLITTTVLLVSRIAFANECVEFSKIPIQITESGCYKLKADLLLNDSTTDAVTIKANNVKIDLNGHRIENLAGPQVRGNGIYANSVRNISIENGHINGFFYAIRIDGSSDGKSSENIKVSNIFAKNNYFRGFSIEAVGAVVEKNKIKNTGGSTVFSDAFSIAVELKGRSCKVANNHIEGVFPIGIGEGVGISLSNNRNNCAAINNVINNRANGRGTFGVWLAYEDVYTTIKKNKIVGFVFPYNVPRLTDKQRTVMKKTTILDNVSEDVVCSPYSYKSYYQGLDRSNRFTGKKYDCSVLIESRKKNYLRNISDSHSLFQLAVSKYGCFNEPPLSDTDCCREQEEAIPYYEKAASLGLAEAARVLPAVKNAVRNSPACKRSR